MADAPAGPEGATVGSRPAAVHREGCTRRRWETRSRAAGRLARERGMWCMCVHGGGEQALTAVLKGQWPSRCDPQNISLRATSIDKGFSGRLPCIGALSGAGPREWEHGGHMAREGRTDLKSDRGSRPQPGRGQSEHGAERGGTGQVKQARGPGADCARRGRAARRRRVQQSVFCVRTQGCARQSLSP